MVLDNTFQKVVTVAPETLVFINGTNTIKICDKCNSSINFNDNIQNIRISNSLNLGDEISPSTASFTLRVPQHSSKVFFRNGKSIFTPMQEISIWVKGYFPRYSNKKAQGGSLKAILGGKNFEFYRCFWGVITKVTPSISASNQTISIEAEDMLYWLKRAKGNKSGIYFGNDEGTFQPTFKNISTANIDKLNPILGIIWLIQRFFMGNAIIKNVEDTIDDSLQYSDAVLADKSPEEKNIGSLVLDWLQKRFSKDITTDFKIFGLNSVDTSLSDINNKIKKNEESIELAQQRLFSKFQQLRKNLVQPNPKINFKLSDTTDLLKSGHLNSIYDQWFNERILTNTSSIGKYISSYKPLSHRSSILSTISYIANLIGWEFYQDMNGSLVLKPPFYNLDVRKNRVQVIRSYETLQENISYKPEQFVSFSEVIGSDGSDYVGNSTHNNFKAFSGSVSNIKYLKELGFRETRTQYGNIMDNHLCQRLAAILMDRQNTSILSGSIEIIGRPEILLGYPIYYEPHDSFYYVTGIEHNIVYGGRFTTTLNLVAGRRPLYESVNQKQTSSKLENPIAIDSALVGGVKEELNEKLKDYFYEFIPKKSEPEATIKSTGPSIPTQNKKIDITFGRNDKIKTIARTKAIFPDGFGYWKLKSKENLSTNSSIRLAFFRSKFSTDYFDNTKEKLPITEIKDWHFPVSDRKGYEHFGLFNYGSILSLTSVGVLEVLSQTDIAEEGIADAIKEIISSTLGRSSHGNSWGIGLSNVETIDDLRNLSYENPRYTEGRDSNVLSRTLQKIMTLPSNAKDYFSNSFCACLIQNSRFKL